MWDRRSIILRIEYLETKLSRDANKIKEMVKAIFTKVRILLLPRIHFHGGWHK